MKSNIFKSVILAVLAIFAFGTVSVAQNQLPDVKVKDIKGLTYNVKDCLKDKVPVVVSFWRTTCKPCIQELDAICDNYEDWQEIAKFKVVAVSGDDARSSAKAAAMSRGRNWPFTILLDQNNDLMRAMNVTLTPALYIYDKNGKLVYSHVGYTPGSEEKIIEVIRGLK